MKNTYHTGMNKAIQNAVTIAYSYIRFSSAKQSEGDSLRRQLEGPAEYCNEKGYTLSTDTMKDLGVSAWHGKNAIKGALAAFLQAVESGAIKPGSVLLIEDIDRLSRQEPLDSLDLIRDIIAKGITIVTLVDRQEYTRQSLKKNPGQLFILLGKCIQANEHSERLSFLVGSAWAEKRKNASTTPMTANTPGWISLVKGEYQLNEHAASMTAAINMALDGKGCAVICKTFNRTSVKPMTRRKGINKWSHTTIRSVLSSRALIGEFQPCKVVDGKQIPDGEVIRNYFPALLDEPAFYRLQNALATRSKSSGKGNKGPKVANLFGQLLNDGRDGSTMHLTSKHKHHINMVSSDSRDGLSDTKSFDYTAFESHFMKWVAEIKISTGRESMAHAIEGKLASTRQKIDQLNSAMDSADAASFPRLIERMKRLELDERNQMDELETEKAIAHGPTVSPAAIGELANQMRELTGEELATLRGRIKLAIAGVVDRIDVYIFSRRMARLCIAHVTMKDGQKREFAVRTSRGQMPISTSSGETFGYLGNSAIDFEAMGTAIVNHPAFVGKMDPEVFAQITGQATNAATRGILTA